MIGEGMNKRGARAIVGGGIVAAALLAILIVTLYPTENTGGDRFRWCLLCRDQDEAGFLLNILLFVPLGVGLRALGLSILRCIALGAALTILIEMLQLHVVHGRFSELNDIVANTLGAVAGVLLIEIVQRALFSSREERF